MPVGEWKTLAGYLYFGRWKKGAAPTHLISIKKRHRRHHRLHLSFSHASPVHLVPSQPGLIGYPATPGTAARGTVAHSQEVCVHKAVTAADEGAIAPARDVNIAGEGENIIETVYLGGMWDCMRR